MLCDGKSIHQIISFPWQNLVNLANWKRSYIICGNFPLLQWNFDSEFLFKFLRSKIFTGICHKKHLIMKSVYVLWLGWGREDGWMDGWMNGLDMQLWVYDLLDLWLIKITVIVIKRKNRRWGVGVLNGTLRVSETAIVSSFTDYGSFRNHVVSYFNFCCLFEVALKGHTAIPWRAGCYNWSSL
jgi:hypothetical protein